MKTSTYKEALELCKKECEKLVQERKLSAFCRKHGLDHQIVRVYIRGAGTKKYTHHRYPKILQDFLNALGYKVSFTVEQHYTFFIDNDELMDGLDN